MGLLYAFWVTDPPPTDPAQQTGGSAGATQLVVPEDLRKQFPDLIDLVLHSESMNDEERQYWINILPIMTKDQLQNLRDILTTERAQLAAIDAQYAKAIEVLGKEEFLKQATEERQQRSTRRSEAETSSKQEAEEKAEEILKHIEGA